MTDDDIDLPTARTTQAARYVRAGHMLVVQAATYLSCVCVLSSVIAGAAIALVIMSASAFADDELPQVSAPTTPPDLVLVCHDQFQANNTVEVWNSGFARENGQTFSAEVTFARIAILKGRRRWEDGSFTQSLAVIDRVSGDRWIDVPTVDAQGKPIPGRQAGVLEPHHILAHCEAAARRF